MNELEIKQKVRENVEWIKGEGSGKLIGTWRCFGGPRIEACQGQEDFVCQLCLLLYGDVE